ncbi:lanthionine synthetase C family protein [Streptomyces sp. KLMMK]|uniref:lanthionine synthetase C family protein n=1 Tax=Streptomyces sp. KLMMK TaxID=3109353 RepID=UPI00300967D3
MTENVTVPCISTAAEQLARELSARLENALPSPGGDRISSTAQQAATSAGAGWERASLNRHAGISILFAHLGHRDGKPHPTTHAYLLEAVTALQTRTPIPGSLYYGMPAVALAASIAAQEPAHYSGLLSYLDETISSGIRRITIQQRPNFNSKLSGTTPSMYDVISGLSGLGRYALTRGHPMRPAAEAALKYLVSLTEPVMVDGQPVPGWWIAQPPPLSHRNSFTRGYFDLGIAHGIAGPLALLSRATLNGLTVDGQTSAIECITDWLLSWTSTDDHGPYWPTIVSLEEEQHQAPRPRNRSRGAAWCYGTPGIARAIQLAGQALARPRWQQTALTATQAIFDRADHQETLYDTGLCHGWAGLLQSLLRIIEDSHDNTLPTRISELTQRIIDQYDPALPYGYRHHSPDPRPSNDLDDAGYLTGAAGIALALLNAADHIAHRPSPPHAPPWDTALLIP